MKIERDMTEKEKETFQAQISAFRDAWDRFEKDVKGLIKEWVENFLDKLMVCGHCRFWPKPEFGENAKCEVQGYMVARKCHACRFFNLDEGEFDAEKACDQIKKYSGKDEKDK